MVVDFVAGQVNDRLHCHSFNRPVQRQLSVDRVIKLFAFVAHVEIELAIRAKDKRVHAVVVVFPADAREEQLALVRLVITVSVGQHKNVRRVRDNDSIAEHAYAERRVNARVLVENSFLVCDTIAIGVFQYHDAVAGRLQDAPALKCRAVVGAFSDPDASARVDVHVGGIPDHRFGGEERNLEAVRHGEFFHGFARGFRTDASRVGGEQRGGGQRQRTEEQ